MFDKIPFSYFGSYFVVSYSPGSGLLIRDIRNGDDDTGAIFLLVLLDNEGSQIPFSCLMQPHLLQVYSLETQELAYQLCFADENTLLLQNFMYVELRLLPKQKYDHINSLNQKTYELHSYSHEIKVLLQARNGMLYAHLPWQRVGNTTASLYLQPLSGRIEPSELSMESYITVPRKRPLVAFPVCAAKSWQHYDEFQAQLPTVNKGMTATRDQACYILFSATVQPEGILKKYAVYMSNNYMTNIWSWDHAFTALAMCLGLPKMAYEQFIFFKDLQHESGIFPDFANNKYCSFSCCKPPIHGYIYQILMRKHPYFNQKDRLQEVGTMLENLSRYWETQRKHGNLFFYNHGNDSGWDNATLFSQGCPIVSADLAAWLITLYDALADIAVQLYPHQESGFRDKATKLAYDLVQELWDQDKGRFIAKKFDGEIVDAQYCLIRLLPLVAAKYLPTAVVQIMLGELRQHLTRYGLATERTDSPDYEAAGYWRGPIWAPSTLLLLEALLRCDQGDFAQEVAERFCQLCQHGGLAENFDAISGKGLEDPAFAWTSSVFLYLGGKLHEKTFVQNVQHYSGPAF